MKFAIAVAFFVLICLGDVRGQHLPREFQDERGTKVIVFLGVDCPISQKYMPVLNALGNAYAGRDVHLQAIIPGKIKKKEIRTFSGAYQATFPVSADRNYGWVRALSATVTPEVFVFDEGSNLQYRGAIDNWFYELGGYRKEASENYLSDAIDAVLAGREPTVKETKALGCFIETPKAMR